MYGASALIRMPPAIKAAVVRVVEASGTNANDVIVAALSDSYGLGFVPSGRRGHPSPGNLRVLVRMSDELKKTIQLDALQRRSNLTDTVIRILENDLGVNVIVPFPSRGTPFGGGRRKWAA
jgi:hypothetical protein